MPEAIPPTPKPADTESQTPQQSLSSPSPAGSALKNRLIALCVFVPTLAVLLTAGGLRPDHRGLGTHTQLGLKPCGFEASTGFPCATCGMTTSFTLTADGRFFDAFVNQPAGMVLAILTAMAVIVSGWALWSGMSLAALTSALWRPRVVLCLIGVVVLGWVYTAGRTAWGV